MLVSILFVTAHLIAGTAPQASPKGHPGSKPHRPHSAPKGHWTSDVELRGTVDGVSGTGTMRVYLPAGYAAKDAAGKRFPLVIALHGWSHTPALFIKKGTLDTWADREGVVVAVPAMGKTVYETAFYPETKGAWTTAPGTRWVGEVVLPYVRQHYRVLGDRGHTAVIGYSTGGRGALLLAETYPAEFVFAGSLSGTYDLMRLQPSEGEYKIHALVYGPRETFGERWTHDNITSPERLAKLPGMRLFIGHGGSDKVVHADQLDALETALKGQPVAAVFVRIADAGHDWTFWNSEWGRVFANMAEAFAPSDGPH